MGTGTKPYQLPLLALRGDCGIHNCSGVGEEEGVFQVWGQGVSGESDVLSEELGLSFISLLAAGIDFMIS